jgi:hypothetical protein
LEHGDRVQDGIERLVVEDATVDQPALLREGVVALERQLLRLERDGEARRSASRAGKKLDDLLLVAVQRYDGRHDRLSPGPGPRRRSEYGVRVELEGEHAPVLQLVEAPAEGVGEVASEPVEVGRGDVMSIHVSRRFGSAFFRAIAAPSSTPLMPPAFAPAITSTTTRCRRISSSLR